MLVMWAVMMFAMMLPSVTPAVTIFGRVRETREAAGRPFAPTGAFVGYRGKSPGSSKTLDALTRALRAAFSRGLCPAPHGNETGSKGLGPWRGSGQRPDLAGLSTPLPGLLPRLPFVAGYLLVWLGFSLFVTAANWGLHAGGVMTAMMGQVAPAIGGCLLVAAGLFQWTRLKNAGLDHCRSPMSFLMHHWREATAGAGLMGLHHGAYCLGCCWLLMLLLFVLGVMNLPWVALLTLVVLAEKTLPRGEIISCGLGLILIAWGTWMIAAP